MSPAPEPEFSRRGFLRGGFLRIAPDAGAVTRYVAASESTGIARILPSACIAFRGTLCVTCHERCPVPGAVLMETGRPRIDAKRCTGCGICIDVCPAPRTAIVRQAAKHPG